MPVRAISDQYVLPSRPPGMPAGKWLYTALREEIVGGRLQPGSRLLSSRRMADQLGLSRGTVVTALEQLQAEGYLEGRAGAGVFVSADAAMLTPSSRRSASAAGVQASPRRHLSSQAARITPFLRFGPGPRRAFRCHLPALDLFPLSLWARIANQRLRGATWRLLVGCGPMGYEPLRQVLCDHLYRARGIQCAPEQVAIVSGVQEALDCLTRLMVNPGDRVCMEDPGYPGARRVFDMAGARVTSVPVDREGMRVPERVAGIRLAYVTPSHQFPLGVTMSLGRRLQLLEWARRTGALVVEDDYDSEYRYEGTPLPALQGLDRHGVVAATGSFSKVLFPALRLGFLVVPPALVDRLTALLSVCGPHPPVAEQAVLCDFIAGGHFHRHVRRMRQVYGQRLQALQAAVRTHLAGRLELSPIEAGLQTAGLLTAGLSSDGVAAAAAADGIDVTPLTRYARRPLDVDGLLLGFAAVQEDEIAQGVEQLARVFDGLGRATKGRRKG